MDKKKKIIILASVFLVLVLAIGGLLGYMFYQNTQTYDGAMAMIEAGNYADAKNELETLKKFSDSENYVSQIEDYYLSIEKARAGLIDEAYGLAGQIDLLPKKDSLLTYVSAMECVGRKDYEFAYEKFMTIINFEDSTDMAANLDSYMAGLECLKEEDYESAKQYFGATGEFLESKDILRSIYDYFEANDCLNEGDIDKATDLLTHLNSSLNVDVLLEEIEKYKKAQSYTNKLDYRLALEIYTELIDFLDSAEMAEKLTSYSQARDAFDSKDYITSNDLFGKLGDFLDSDYLKKDSLYNEGITLIATGKHRQAGNYFADVVLDESFLVQKFGEAYEQHDDNLNDIEGWCFKGKQNELTKQYWSDSGAEVSLFYHHETDPEPVGFSIRYETSQVNRSGFYDYDMTGSYVEAFTW